jgi:electron transfer flavoprotein alpha subunit
MGNNNPVLVIGEVRSGEISAITGELLAAAQSLQGGNEGVLLSLRSSGIDDVGQKVTGLAVQKVYVTVDPLLDEYHNIDAHLTVVEKLISEVQPRVVLFGGTLLGRDAGPRIAFRLKAGFAQDCVTLRFDENSGELIAERPVYGGASMARVAVVTSQAIATIRPGIFDPLPSAVDSDVETIQYPVDLGSGSPGVKLINQVRDQVEGQRLEDADIVVAGGRGFGGPEPFEDLESLARLLGGAMGASRAACDAGWLSHAHQIGLTGKSISANLYLTFAISGASQHMAGVSAVKNIVAVNKDENANIFNDSRFGVIGDWGKVLPAFTEKVRELLGS